MLVSLDLLRCPDGRLEGTVTTETGQEHPFSGTLDLLRILEDLDPGQSEPREPAVRSR